MEPASSPFDPKLAGMDTYKPAPAMNWYYTQQTGSGLTTPTGMIEIYHQPFADAYGENGPISVQSPSGMSLRMPQAR